MLVLRLKLDLDPLANRAGVAMHGPGSMKEQSDSTKWGMSRDQTVEIVKQAERMKNVNLRETHFHLSRMTNDPRDFAVMAREMIVWSDYIREKRAGRHPASTLAVAGRSASLTGPDRKAKLDDSTAPTPEDYAEHCCAAIKDEAKKRGLPLPKLRMEPGRSLSGPSEIAVGKVGAVKQGEKKLWANLDLSTNSSALGRWSSTGITMPCPWFMPMPRRPKWSTSSVPCATPMRSVPSE